MRLLPIHLAILAIWSVLLLALIVQVTLKKWRENPPDARRRAADLLNILGLLAVMALLSIGLWAEYYETTWFQPCGSTWRIGIFGLVMSLAIARLVGWIRRRQCQR